MFCGCVDNLVETEDPIADNDDNEIAEPEYVELYGKVQKGPFISGGNVTVYLLDEELKQTGKSFRSEITGADGTYSFDNELEKGLANLSATGFFYDEVKGTISESSLTLETLTELDGKAPANINILTALSSKRIEKLVSEGKTFAEAVRQAKGEVLSVFHISSAQIGNVDFGQMDLTGSGVADAALLAVSVTMASGRTVGEMSSLIASISSEIASTGSVSQKTSDRIASGLSSLDLEAVRENLTRYWSESGIDGEVPEFEGFMDMDWNGTVDKEDSWLILGSEEIWVPDTGGSYEVELKHNIEYDVSVESPADSWIRIEPLSKAGILETSTICFSVSANGTYDKRTGRIAVKDRKSSRTEYIAVYQKQKDALTVTNDTYNIGMDGGRIEIEVKSNVSYDVRIEQSAEGWIHKSPETKGLVSDILVFDVDRIEDPVTRTGHLVFSSGDIEETVTVYQTGERILVLDKHEYVVSDKGEIVDIIINTNCTNIGAELTGEADWISQVQTKGMDTHVLSLRIAPNLTYSDRQVGIIVHDYDSDLSDICNIYQVQNNALILAKETYYMNSDGGDVQIGVQHNIPVEAVVYEDAVSWISQVKTKALETSYFTFHVAANESLDNIRSGLIIFSGGGLSDVVQIMQSHKNALVITQDTVSLDSSGGEFSIEVEANFGYGVEITEGSSWLHRINTDTRGMVNSRIYFKAAANTGPDDRTGLITVFDSSSGLKETVTVIQKQKNTIETGKDRFDLPYSGGRIDIPVKSNVSYMAEISEGIDWISEIPATKGLTESVISFMVSENESLSERTGKISIKGSDSDISREISIVQAANTENVTIHVEKAGTLRDIIDKETLKTIRNLTITGNLNSDDTGILCTKSTIADYRTYLTETLDLSGATFENDRLTGFFGLPFLKSVKLPSSLRAIYRAFDECFSLESVDLGPDPELEILGCGAYQNNISSLDKSLHMAGAFSQCTSLTEFVLPETVKEIQAGAFYKSGIRKLVFPENCKITVFAPTEVQVQNSLGGIQIVKYGMFCGCDRLEQIEIPESVVLIMDSAFKGWSGARSVTIPETVKQINTDFLFSGCTSLEYVSMPGCTDRIGESMFSGCRSLENFDFKAGYRTIGKAAFSGCKSLTSICLDGVTEFGEEAFSGCGFTSFRIPDQMTEIPEGMFYKCEKLEEIDFNCTEIIGPRAFEGCPGLTEVVIPANVHEVSGGAFRLCENLVRCKLLGGNIHFGGGVFWKEDPDKRALEEFYICKDVISLTSYGKTMNTCGKNDFSNFVFEEGSRCEEFSLLSGQKISSSFRLPSSVKRVGDYAFYESDFSEADPSALLSGIVEIGDFAFSLSNITSIDIPYGVEKLGMRAFSDCNDLMYFTMPSTVRYIGNMCFSRCRKLMSSTLNGADITLGYDSSWEKAIFYDCPLINKVIISKDVKSIKNETDVSMLLSENITSVEFEQGSQCEEISGPVFSAGHLLEVSLPENLKILGDKVFYNSFKLSSVSLPSTLRSIGSNVFQGCKFDFLSIPESVESIGRYIIARAIVRDFEVSNGYPNMLDILAGAEIENLIISSDVPDNFLSGYSKSVKIIVSEGVRSLGNSAFADCKFITDISLPESLESIGDYAFSGCKKISSITVPGSVKSLGINPFVKCESLSEIVSPLSPDGKTLLLKGKLVSCVPAATYPDLFITGDQISSIGSKAFFGAQFKTIVISDKVTSLDDGALTGNVDSLAILSHIDGMSAGIFGSFRTRSLYFENDIVFTSEIENSNKISVSDLWIGRDVARIDSRFLKSLNNLYLQAPVPPVWTGTFDLLMGRRIYIPCGTIDAYKAAWGSRNFIEYCFPE